MLGRCVAAGAGQVRPEKSAEEPAEHSVAKSPTMPAAWQSLRAPREHPTASSLPSLGAEPAASRWGRGTYLPKAPGRTRRGAWSRASRRGWPDDPGARSARRGLRGSAGSRAPGAHTRSPARAVDGCKSSCALIGPTCQKRWRQPRALPQRAQPSGAAPPAMQTLQPTPSVPWSWPPQSAR